MCTLDATRKWSESMLRTAYVKDPRRMSSIYHNMINPVFSIEIRGSPSRLVDIKVLESDARDNHVLCGSEGYQSEAIVACFLVQIVFSDCWAKNTFSPHFRVKIANQNFNIRSGHLLYRTSSLSYKASLAVSSLSSVSAWAHIRLM